MKDVCRQTAYYCDNDRDGFFSSVPLFCTGSGCVPTNCRANAWNGCDDAL